ncbi:uncharacterized protein EI90DRAFT_3020598 [Cantharellus anzutake]|uniref:uncharacterized protein n=1 Tax=Cantharellus anzutake TaxID=1750568 RepID=UPI00190733F7|nr:uncharacterized protein EI90DRAFT_3020598 [Cantharellus anzutake]KAF8319887.1 hypothetical protein EI90DRAFT_3020598 [Cantharellus anzutake]
MSDAYPDDPQSVQSRPGSQKPYDVEKRLGGEIQVNIPTEASKNNEWQRRNNSLQANKREKAIQSSSKLSDWRADNKEPLEQATLVGRYARGGGSVDDGDGWTDGWMDG